MLRAIVRRRGGAVVLSLCTIGLLLLTLLGVSFVRERIAAAKPTSPAAHTATAQRDFGRVPLAFEANQGQADASLRFVAHGAGYVLGLGPTQAMLALQTTPPPALPNPRAMQPGAPPPAPLQPASPPVVVTMSWLGASATARMTGEQQLPGIVNYFIGHDPSQWHTNIPTYKQVRYTGVYPGIDLVYYGTGSALEYDFVVAPGADAARIALGFRGQQRLAVDLSGNLVLTLPGGQTLSLQKPVLYQQVNGARKPVSGSYHLGSGNRVSFALGAYDHTAPLVIDPVFIYSTYLGGNFFDQGNGIATDTSGDAYVVGSTASDDFPIQDPMQPYIGGYSDVFVSKLNASGNALIYSTYLGGNNYDDGYAITVDASGDAYVTGTTWSTNFPTVNPIQASSGGEYDAFVSKLNASGSALVYSTYLGGNSYDGGNAIAVDANGDASITGDTFSPDFPISNALQAKFLAGIGGSDAFVSKLTAAGSAFVFSTYLSGSAGAVGSGIAVDSSGDIYVAGGTGSSDFPTVNPLQATNAGGADAFVSKFNASGSALIYSTYLGGSGSDFGFGIALDTGGNAYVTGYTDSTNFPVTPGAFQTSKFGIAAFVSKLSASGAALIYSTYLSGGAIDQAYGIAVDTGGHAYVTGDTESPSFPLERPVQAVYNQQSGNVYYPRHVFISELDASGSTLSFSTFLEGAATSDTEIGSAIAVDDAGDAYITGNMVDTDFPVTQGALQTALAGFDDAFVARLQPNAAQRNDTIGVYRPATSSFYLRNANNAGPADLNVTFGVPGDIPVAGDWTGKGYDSVGVYRPSNHTFYLRNSNTTGRADLVITFGTSGDIPVAGDWTGKGYDSVGVYRPSTGQFFLRNSNTTGPADIRFTFGRVGDTPLVGDWTRQGKTTVGVYRPSTQTFYLRNSNTTGYADISYHYGVAGAVPVMGDWLGQGRDTPAYTIASSSAGNPFEWDQRYLNSDGPVQAQFLFGASASDTPLAGQWQPGP